MSTVWRVTAGTFATALLTMTVACAGPATSLPAMTAAAPPTPPGAAARDREPVDPGGRITRMRWSEDPARLYYTVNGERLAFDLTRGEVVAEFEEPTASRDDGDRRRRPARGRQRARETSPDGQWVAISRDWNVVLESADDESLPIEVTTDGRRKVRYGTASWVYGEELAQTTAMWWSPDSRKLVFYKFDEQAVPDFYLVQGWTDLRTKTIREGYPKPGEPNPAASLLIYDVASGQTITIDATSDRPEEEWYVYNVRFAPDGDEVLLNRTNRHQSHLDVMAADLDTGQCRIVVSEQQATWQENRPQMRFLDDGHRFVWETERSGVKQYELRHLDGRSLGVLTSQPRPVVSIVRIDEPTDTLFYTAYGDDHPLNVHLYRVSFDGGGLARLTTANRSHRVSMSPDGRWFTTSSETIADPPRTTVHAATDGRELAVLAEPDLDAWRASGLPSPELFSYLAEDGTPLYGWLLKPAGFDPDRQYPLLVDVYGGPDSKGVRQRFRSTHPGARHGFLVAKFDNRGTGGRGKAFLGAVYQKLGTVDIQDQVDGVRALLTRPYVDPDRVGIYGHSYGGYLSALAILKYPEVFTVAVAGAPVTDWRNYDTIYTERYMRTPQENESGYDEGSCLTYVDQLRGRLLILHGMMDDNVHPNNTWQLVDALQRAGKSFDVMIYPDAGHGLGGHAASLRWEYLRKHLLPPAYEPASPQVATR